MVEEINVTNEIYNTVWKNKIDNRIKTWLIAIENESFIEKIIIVIW